MSVKMFCERCKEYHRDCPDIIRGILSRHRNDGKMENELIQLRKERDYWKTRALEGTGK